MISHWYRQCRAMHIDAGDAEYAIEPPAATPTGAYRTQVCAYARGAGALEDVQECMRCISERAPHWQWQLQP